MSDTGLAMAESRHGCHKTGLQNAQRLMRDRCVTAASASRQNGIIRSMLWAVTFGGGERSFMEDGAFESHQWDRRRRESRWRGQQRLGNLKAFGGQW